MKDKHSKEVEDLKARLQHLDSEMQGFKRSSKQVSDEKDKME